MCARGTEMASEKRIEWIDLVKYVCIIMVMLSHLESRTKIWSEFYSPFYLTAFFFTAGYVYRPRGNFKSFLYRKFRQLFVPWLVFSVLDILLSQMISFHSHGDLLEELKWNFLQIRGKGDQIWFVAALFVAFLPFYFFIQCYEYGKDKKGSRFRCAIALAAAWLLSLGSLVYATFTPAEIFPWKSAALPWHIEYMFQAMFYMVFGYLFRHNMEEWFDRHNSLRMRVTSIAIYGVLLVVSCVTDIRANAAVDIPYQYIVSFVGILTLVSIAKVVRTNPYINFVGQNTLIYFALHGKVYSVIQTLLKKFAADIYTAILGNTIASTFFCLLLSLVLSIVLIIPTYLINRYFPFVVGRKK